MTLQILNHDAFAARDISVPVTNMPLEIGETAFSANLTARIFGDCEAPLILVLGGISAGRNICGDTGWWRDIVGKGKAIDLSLYCVIGFDFIPGNEDAQEHDFITSGDQATALTHILKHLGRKSFHAIIGSSYGGMVALQFAAKYPDRVGRLAVFGASHRASQMSVARRSLQRRIIDMASKFGDTKSGLALARELAMTTYRSAEEFDERFAAPNAGENGEISAEVDDYLMARGQAYSGVMSAERFKILSRSIDLHAVEPEQITVSVSMLACRQDQIVPLKDMKALHDHLGANADLELFDSACGHDAFLTETKIISRFLQDILEQDISDDQ